MIVIRNVFRLKFGKAREAVALFKESNAIQKRVGAGAEFQVRLLTDVTGAFYTVVMEITAPSLAAFEAGAPQLMGNKDWQWGGPKKRGGGGFRGHGERFVCGGE